MNEMKRCPFCRAEVQEGVFYPKNMIVGKHKEDCPLYERLLDTENWNRRPEEDALLARIGELEEALIKAKVAMDWLGDRMNDMDVVEEQDNAITDPLFADVDKVLKGIDPDGSRVKQEEQIAEARGEEALKGADSPSCSSCLDDAFNRGACKECKTLKGTGK